MELKLWILCLSSRSDADFDRDKLRAYTGEPLYYSFGAFIEFSTGESGDFLPIEWFAEP